MTVGTLFQMHAMPITKKHPEGFGFSCTGLSAVVKISGSEGHEKLINGEQIVTYTK